MEDAFSAFEAVDARQLGTIPSKLLAVPQQYADYVDDVLLSHGLILDRIDRLARSLHRALPAGGEVVCLCTLKGASQFFGDLLAALKRLNIDNDKSVRLTPEYIRASSYVDTRSTGNVKLSGIDADSLTGKHVLIVEDIVDTGRSATALVKAVQEAKPASVLFATLVLKANASWNGFRPDFVGFVIPDAFVVGYSLDYNEAFRDLDHLCILNAAGQAAFASV